MEQLEEMRRRVKDLLSLTGDGPGSLSDTYRIHFNKVDRFNAGFYQIGPPLTQRNEPRRIYLDLLLIAYLNAHCLYCLQKAKEAPDMAMPSYKGTLEMFFLSQ